MAPNETENGHGLPENMNKIDSVKVQNNSETVENNDGCCKKLTDRIILSLENCLGSLVARYPSITITLAVLISGLCIIGVIEYYAENRPEKLWVASDSKSLEHQLWVSGEYPPQSRVVTLIAERDDILTPAGMSAICNLHQDVTSMFNGTDLSWEKICLALDRNGTICLPNTILLIWKNNCTLVKSLDEQAILDGVNSNIMLRTGKPLNVKLLLGDIMYVNGNITKAKATKMTYFIRNQEKYVESKGQRIDEKGEKWELEFTRLFENGYAGFDNVFTYSRAGNRQESGDTISGDLKFLFAGYVLIIVYLSTMLGGFSRINHKVWLAVAGVLCIGLAIGIAYGLSSAFQLDVTPVHNVLPFLLLGIGVDDVFVIVQNWDNVGGPTNNDVSVADNISKAMRYAGVSILVTSFTDVCAFLIGATTILPALRSFCIFAGIGVLAVFILTVTFFLALLTIDSRRQRDRRDACCCCIKLNDDWKPLECSKKMYLQEFMKTTYSKIILSTQGRIAVLLIWAGILAGGAYGLSQLKQDFDPDWFLAPDSKARLFNEADDKYFNTEGIEASVYLGAIDYFGDQDNMLRLAQSVDVNKYVVNGSTRSWYEQYRTWLQISPYKMKLTEGKPKNEADFYLFLNVYLSTAGQIYFKDVKRNNDSLKTIRASRITFTHIKLQGASNEIKAMDSVQETVKAIKFNKFEAFAYTRFYIGWETNKVISEELIRNLALAGVIVLLVTLFLIANVWVSLMVLSCVVFTLINIAGYMHFWGLTVDTVTTILLILAIGLSVDYSAHIGHGFMASREGTRIDRASNALAEIGPAVIHGGFSTFLAFVCLAGSQSYVFSTFFKLFFLVVVFGLFHGLVYLPVILSLVGPKAYAKSQPIQSEHEMKVTKAQNINQTNPPAPIGKENEAYTSVLVS